VNDCDVLAAADCGNGKSCQIIDPTGNVACVTSGSAGAGDACSAVNTCQPGFSCVGGTCRRLCRAQPGGGEPACASDEGVCVHFAGNPPGVGVCTLL
jgi:hypothetical protein